MIITKPENPKITLQKQLKAKYGVTFTDKMGVSEILEAWDRVPEEIKSLLPPPVALSIDIAQQAYTTAVNLRTTYATLKLTYDTTKQTLEDLSSAAYDSGATTAARGATEVPKAVEIVQDMAVQQANTVLMEALNSYVPIPIPVPII